MVSGKQLYDSIKDKDAIIMCVNMRSPLSVSGIIQAAKKANAFVVFQLEEKKQKNLILMIMLLKVITSL
jgi:fructose/tagatose bisphosphate aldolase